MRALDIIRKKRDGGELSQEEIEFFTEGVVSGAVPEYQASAFLMAVYFKGMGERANTLWEVSIESGIERRFADLQGKRGRLADLATDGEHLYFIWGEASGVGDIWVMDVVRE